MSKPSSFDFHFLSDNLPGLILWRKNKNSIYTQGNDACAKLFGFKRNEDMIGISDCDIPCDVSQYADLCKKTDIDVMSSRKPLRIIRTSRYAGGMQKTLLINKTPIFDKNNSVIGTSAYCLDFSEVLNKLSQLITSNEMKYDHQLKLQANYHPNENYTAKIKLTKRQSECLFFLLRGKTAKESAKILKICHRTVENYIDQLKLKFNCQTKSELISKALDQGYMNIIPKRLFEEQLLLLLD